MRPLYALLCAGVLAAITASAAAESEEERAATSLAVMLEAARTVISNNQALINDPDRGDKGLTPDKILGDSAAIYKMRTGVDPTAIDPQTLNGRLLRAQMDAIAKVMTDVQPIINKPGVDFKGIIPSAFARMINDEFQERMGNEAVIKVTAPPDLIRNRKARPDAWETEMIAAHLAKPDWPKGQSITAHADARGRPAFRFLIPEYYTASCLSCHGSPKGEIDITGYPKEGRHEGELGGVISISIFRR